MRSTPASLLALPLLLLALGRPAPAAEPTFRVPLGGDENYRFPLALAGRTLVVGNPADEQFSLFDAKTGAPRATVPCPNVDPYFGESCGWSVAASRRTVAVGGSSYAYLYDRGGRLLREIPSPHPDWARFGAAVALHGNRLLVGAPSAPDGGAAHLYDAAGGTLLRSFANPDPATPGFGDEVVLLGRIAIVGTPGLWTGPTMIHPSKVWAFDARTGVLLWDRASPDGLSGPGLQLAALGRDVVVAPGVHRFRGDTGALVRTWIVPGGRPGRSVAADGRTVAVGDTGFGEHGAVHLFDAVSGALLETIETSEPASEPLGLATVIDGRRLVATSHPYAGDGTLFGFRR